jgi:porphobilinogen deaminase
MPEDIEDESVVVEVETTGEEEQDTRAQVSSNDDGDELDSYSKNVQTRIKKLTEKYRNEERVRTEAERLYQQVLAENQQLKGRVQNLDKGYLNEFGGRLEGQIESAKRLYREAHDSGDVDAMLAAQDQLNRMGIEQERLRIAKQRAEVQQPERQQYVTQQQNTTGCPSS